MKNVEIKPSLENEINTLIEVGLYSDKSELIADAVENLLLSKKQSRIDVAIRLYRQDCVTLEKAASLAGMHRFEFEAILSDLGIEKVISVASAEEIQIGVSLIRQLHEQTD